MKELRNEKLIQVRINHYKVKVMYGELTKDSFQELVDGANSMLIEYNKFYNAKTSNIETMQDNFAVKDYLPTEITTYYFIGLGIVTYATRP